MDIQFPSATPGIALILEQLQADLSRLVHIHWLKQALVQFSTMVHLMLDHRYTLCGWDNAMCRAIPDLNGSAKKVSNLTKLRRYWASFRHCCAALRCDDAHLNDTDMIMVAVKGPSNGG